jgi:hypothetical protein
VSVTAAYFSLPFDDDRTARQYLEELLAVGERHPFRLTAVLGRFTEGALLAAGNRSADGVRLMRESLGELQASGVGNMTSILFAVVARRCLALGMADEARAVLAEAAIVVERGDCLASAEVCRLRGALHEVDGRLEESENCHRQALSIAREQSALTWELRAATSLARLLGAQDRVAEARQLLAGVCARFTEGRDTSDFREAAGILASWRERER